MAGTFVTLAGLVASVALFGGCEGGGTTMPPSSPPPPPLVPADSVAIALEAPDSVTRGTPVEFVLVVRNLRDESVELLVVLPPRTFNFEVIDESGEVTWRRLPEFIPLAATRITLQPGERREYREMWPQVDEEGGSVAPGDYSVRGILNTSSFWATDDKPLTILPSSAE